MDFGGFNYRNPMKIDADYAVPPQTSYTQPRMTTGGYAHTLHLQKPQKDVDFFAERRKEAAAAMSATTTRVDSNGNIVQSDFVTAHATQFMKNMTE